jgi:NAD(P)-dependent dehydrogenase (short-subunit alcohol dehydrogenase family)
VKAAVDAVVARAGRLDLMFNNAGIAWGGDTELLTLDQWNAIIDVNIRGVVHGVTAAYPVMLRQGHGHIVNTASMAGLTAAGQITSYVMTKHAIVGLSLALRSEAVPRGVGVLAVCPGAVETPILDKGAIGGFVGRDYYLRGQGMKNAYSADRLARDTLKAIGRNKALLVKPRSRRTRPGCSPGWRRVCCSACRFGSSPTSASGKPLTQPLLEELDDSLARLVGRVTVDLTDLVGQHRMRHPGEAVLIAWAGVDFDHLERVAQPLFERGEPFAGRQPCPR